MCKTCHLQLHEARDGELLDILVVKKAQDTINSENLYRISFGNGNQ